MGSMVHVSLLVSARNYHGANVVTGTCGARLNEDAIHLFRKVLTRCDSGVRHLVKHWSVQVNHSRNSGHDA